MSFLQKLEGDTIVSIVFNNPIYLWLLLGLFILIITYFIDIGWRRRKGIVFANISVIERVTKRKILQRSLVLFTIRAIALALVIFALADMVIWYDGLSTKSDIVFAIDSSASMLADDFSPSRLESSKAVATDLISTLDLATEVGVVSFAGTSLVSQPLTTDRIALKSSIKEIDVIRTGGTAIGEAIIISANLLIAKSDRGDRGNSLILITDGQSNVGLSVGDATSYANKHGVTINTIGMATEEGGKFAEASAISQLDKKTLIEIAESTGGKYHNAETSDQLKTAILDIFSLKQGKVAIKARIHLLLAAVFLLFIEWVLVNTEYRIRP